jgi:hypothetical protein
MRAVGFAAATPPSIGKDQSVPDTFHMAGGTHTSASMLRDKFFSLFRYPLRQGAKNVGVSAVVPSSRKVGKPTKMMLPGIGSIWRLFQ